MRFENIHNTTTNHAATLSVSLVPLPAHWTFVRPAPSSSTTKDASFVKLGTSRSPLGRALALPAKERSTTLNKARPPPTLASSAKAADIQLPERPRLRHLFVSLVRGELTRGSCRARSVFYKTNNIISFAHAAANITSRLLRYPPMPVPRVDLASTVLKKGRAPVSIAKSVDTAQSAPQSATRAQEGNLATRPVRSPALVVRLESSTTRLPPPRSTPADTVASAHTATPRARPSARVAAAGP